MCVFVARIQLLWATCACPSTPKGASWFKLMPMADALLDNVILASFATAVPWQKLLLLSTPSAYLLYFWSASLLRVLLGSHAIVGTLVKPILAIKRLTASSRLGCRKLSMNRAYQPFQIGCKSLRVQCAQAMSMTASLWWSWPFSVCLDSKTIQVATNGKPDSVGSVS